MILVTAATGHLGRLIVQELIKQQGSAKGLAVSVRDPQKADDLKAAGVEVRKADYTDVASLKAAFAGVDTLVFISGDSPMVAERIGQHKNVVDAAKASGVKRVLYTSFLDLSADAKFPFTPIHKTTEDYIKASGLGWTMLHPSIYADVGLAQQAVQTGVLATAAGTGSVSYIVREDIARATAAAALKTETGNTVYELTGPEAVKYPGFAEVVSKVSGKPVQFKALTFEELSANLKQAGLPGFVVDIVTGLQQDIVAGRFSKVSNDVAALTGKPADGMEAILRRELSGN